jgi:hypothetical protein
MESPAFSDPRQTDVAAVRKILDTVTETGKVAKLPTMGAAELYALGALTHPLLDEFALSWWNARPDRESAARWGYDHMVKRNMIDPATGRVHPQLGVILAARARPAFIVVQRLRPDGNPGPSRFLGIADETAGLRAVLGEATAPIVSKENEAAGPVYIYELSSPPKAARLLAELTAERKQYVIDFYLPGAQTSLPSERFTVTHALRRLRVERVTPTAVPQRLTCSEEELAELLLGTMTGACT